MTNPIQLSTAQQFEIESLRRLIDTSKLDELKPLCAKLAEAWFLSKSSTEWAMRNSLSIASTVEIPYHAARATGFDFPL